MSRRAQYLGYGRAGSTVHRDVRNAPASLKGYSETIVSLLWAHRQRHRRLGEGLSEPDRIQEQQFSPVPEPRTPGREGGQSPGRFASDPLGAPGDRSATMITSHARGVIQMRSKRGMAAVA